MRMAAVAGFALPAFVGSAAWLAGGTDGAGLGLMHVVTATAAAGASAALLRPLEASADPWTPSVRAPFAEAAFLFAAGVVVAAMFAVQAWLAPSVGMLLLALGGVVAGVVLSARGIPGVAAVAAVAAVREAAVRQPWPATNSMDEALARRTAVAAAARSALEARRHTADVVSRTVRPWSVVAFAAPALPVVVLIFAGGESAGGAGGVTAPALLSLVLAWNLMAAVAVALGLRRRERPSRGVAVAAAALCAGLGFGLLWLGVVGHAGWLAVLLLSLGQAGLAAVLVWLTLRIHALWCGEPPLPGLTHLVDALGHRDERVRHTAHITLRTLTGADVAESPRAWRTWLQDALERTGKLPRPTHPVSIHEVPPLG